MELFIDGNDHFELMWNLPKVIDPKDFPTGMMSYFTFQMIQEGRYKIQVAEKTYTDEWLFMDEVSSKIAKRQIYGFISYSNDELTLGFHGLHFIAEYERVGDQWALRWFEDDNIREQSLVERRFEVSKDFVNLKKALS